ncbi:MAG TPA: plastocyanin/azurin family copper-binding protein [Solirubrobacteraceae bacterium]|jgi:plastocyanin|nr:plastocyanin/azurin family copper-binding protein [Solirubrobacteraceae bacterium]
MKINARHPLILVVAAVAIPVASAAGAPVGHAAATHVVKLQNIMIHPSTVRIHPGDRITWEFLDGPSAEHTVTSDAHKGGLRFKGTGPKLSGTYTVKFTKKGTYYYECTIHPGMNGKIVVR